LFIKVTQLVMQYKHEESLSGDLYSAPFSVSGDKKEIINWVNSDSIDRFVEGENGVSICFVSGNDIDVKETADEILKQIPEGN
jgi:uncharacterized protein YlzI (FlbEa/FlbD family)